jgi:GntR family transcriptional regulator
MISFHLDPNSGVPIYRQVKDQVRFGLASGLLFPGDQLPTVRALAVQLSVNPNTIIKAYSELEHEGVLTSEQGSGTFVSAPPVPPLSRQARASKLQSLCLEFLADAARYGLSSKEIVSTIQQLT